MEKVLKAGFFLLFASVLTLSVQAQDRRQFERKGEDRRHEMRAERAEKGLNLDEKQQAKMKDLDEKYEKKAKKQREKAQKQMKKAKKEQQKMREEKDAEMKKILTTEQYEKWKERKKIARHAPERGQKRHMHHMRMMPPTHRMDMPEEHMRPMLHQHKDMPKEMKHKPMKKVKPQEN